MSRQLIRYNEPLEEGELAFLLRKEEKDRKQFYTIIKVFMIFSFVLPFFFAWVRAAKGAENPFSYLTYFMGVAFLTCFSGMCVYIAYKRTLYKVQSDIRDRTKTIEPTHITRKQYMPHNNTYYFYIDSPNKLSIEVSERDYHDIGEGDELNIEYTTHSQLYLGYF